MLQHTFECEALTPLFLGGADPRGTPELRAPSLRGAMRYWYRALLGGTSAPTLASLHEAESALFGRAEDGGALATRLRVIETRQKVYEKDGAARTPQGDFLPTGKDYLLWSMSSTGRPGTNKYQPPREYLEPGSKFEFTLSAKLDDEVLKKGAAARRPGRGGAIRFITRIMCACKGCRLFDARERLLRFSQHVLRAHPYYTPYKRDIFFW